MKRPTVLDIEASIVTVLAVTAFVSALWSFL